MPGNNIYYLRYSPERDLFNETCVIPQELFRNRVEEIFQRYKSHHFATWNSKYRIWKKGNSNYLSYKGASVKLGGFYYYLILGGVVALTPNSIILQHESKKGIKSLANLLDLPFRKRKFLNEKLEFRKNNE